LVEQALIVFLPSGRRGRFPVGTRVLQAARELGVDIDSICGGRGICGRCQVAVQTGEFPKFGVQCRIENLSPLAEREHRYDALSGLVSGRRFACAAQILGDLVVDVPDESQLHRQIVRKDAHDRPVRVDRVVRLHYVELDPPTIRDQRSDKTRLEQGLREQWGIEIQAFDQALLRDLPRAMREGAFKVTAAVREGRCLSAVWPGFRDRAFGLAVDVGTTTLAAQLCDLATGQVVAAAGLMNPQIRFGEDLISRVSYYQQNPGRGGELTSAVRRAVGQLAASTAAEAGIEHREILDAVIVGNPVMHHLLLGIDPCQLGRAPFPLVVDCAMDVRAGQLGLKLHPGARAYLLPCIAGHVGADTAGMLLAEAPHTGDEMTLLVDVGTNAELVLGNRDRLLACSSPTGPAFEGAQISCGQRAAVGAIERVRVDHETLSSRFKVIGSELWSDEPGFADSIAGFGVTGICGSGIIEAVAELHLAGLVSATGLVDGSRAAHCPQLERDGHVYAYRLHAGPPVVRITQTDVRAIQLAKGALYAGARLLMDRMGVTSVDRIVLAGAFGSYIDPLHAMVLGMIPDCPLERVVSAGNAAGNGARIALLNRGARREIEALVRRVEKVETAAAPGFQRDFVAAMQIPHARDAFPSLQVRAAREDGTPDAIGITNGATTL
jgi:uncharacterized 2Fe-2S/4Fe-4S cluster protein (DUF4445 family)